MQVNGTTWSHSRDFDTCLDTHALRKLWNPSILHWIGDGKEGNNLHICEQLILNSVPLSCMIFIDPPYLVVTV